MRVTGRSRYGFVDVGVSVSRRSFFFVHASPDDASILVVTRSRIDSRRRATKDQGDTSAGRNGVLGERKFDGGSV